MGKTTLVIMAAGMGSRYGAGIKQLERVGTSGEIIMEYSIYDAIAAGFDKIVFITRKDIEEEFKKIVSPRISELVETEYVFQELDCLPEGYTVPEGRKKPWGTGHAILCCKDVVKEPFAIINADDYYGKEAFVKLHDFLAKIDEKPLSGSRDNVMQGAMVGFVLGNTLSENGEVTRGVCHVDSSNHMSDIEETFGISQKGNVAVGKTESGVEKTIPLDTPVSMNMWGVTPEFFTELETGFKKFLDSLEDMGEKKEKAEYLLPMIIGNAVDNKTMTIDVLKSQDKWFGVTFKEDRDMVVKSFKKLCEEGKYPVKLFA